MKGNSKAVQCFRRALAHDADAKAAYEKLANSKDKGKRDQMLEFRKRWVQDRAFGWVKESKQLRQHHLCDVFRLKLLCPPIHRILAR